MIKIDEARTLEENDSDNGPKYVYKDGKPKSARGVRSVAVPKVLLDLLQAKRKTQKEISKRIFTGRPDNYSSRFTEMVNKHNLPKVRFHDLRHYQASWLYANDTPDQYAAQRLGHTIDVLKSIYHHLGSDQQKDLDCKVRKLFGE